MHSLAQAEDLLLALSLDWAEAQCAESGANRGAIRHKLLSAAMAYAQAELQHQIDMRSMHIGASRVR